MINKITYSNSDLFRITKDMYGSITNLSIDWLYNPIKAVSEKAILFMIDGYSESITVRQLLNMSNYGLE